MRIALKDPGEAKSGPKQPKRVSYSEFLAGDTTDPESDNQVEKIQPNPPLRTSARRPRKATVAVTVYDRDAGVGELPPNLMRIQGEVR
jgi:hypothetical protein